MFIKDSLYKQILQNTTIITVDIVLLNKDKTQVLLFKRNNKPLKGEYYLPGGRIHKNEKLIDAAIRKSQEEFNLDLTENELQFGGFTEEFYDETIYENTNLHDINFYYYYVLEDSSKKLKLDPQHTNYKWFDIKELNLHTYIKDKLKSFL